MKSPCDLRFRAPLLVAVAFMAGVGGVVVASTDRAPVSELEFFRAEAGDTWASMTVEHSLTCTGTQLRDANGRNPINPGLVVFVPPSCVAPVVTTTTAPTTTTTVPPTTTTTTTTTVAPSTGWPDASNTGVPSGVTLTQYTGPCTITVANTVIDAKTINCSLGIRAANVVVARSVINGTIGTDENSTGYSFSISDSEVRVGDQPGTAIGAVNFTALRVEVTGGNRSVNCWKNCDIRDSYVHGQMSDETGVYHESGIRMGSDGTLIGNSIACDAPDFPPDAGCSASLTGYGDFAPVGPMLVQGNLLKATTGGFCAYGGSSGGKPYSTQAHDIRFVDNVFERGPGGKCGYWGPITDFDPTRPGNVWSGNVWDDGGIVPPA